jgi:phosphoglycolate phosphatase-like HAD superfamily hydrolase
MVALRSRRLEAMLGSRLDNIKFDQVASLATSQVPEAFDLDYKSALYGRSDDDKRKLAGDVAALANTAGGLIIIGIDEDDQARASALSTVALSDDEVGRMHQVIASLTAPLPEFGIIPLEDPANPGTGFLLIAVPRSPRQPHSVLVGVSLRFPRRNGSTTRYLTESEVAAAYRDRFASADGQAARLDEVERDLLDRLNPRRYPWVVVSLIPDLPGDLIIDAAKLREFHDEVVGSDPLIMGSSLRWQRAVVGRRRLVADGSMDETLQASWLAAELHSDGSGAFGVVLGTLSEGWPTEDSAELRVSDEGIVVGTLSGLRLLARHARDRAAAGGGALVSARLFPATASNPLRVGHARGFMNLGGTLGNQALTESFRSTEQIVELEDLAADGPALLSAAYVLCSDLFQAVGYPEVLQTTRDGKVRRRYWNTQVQPALQAWATQAGVEITEDTVE